MDFVLNLGLAICFIGQLYFFYLAITYGDREHPPSATALQVQPPTRYDPLTGHVWTVAPPSLHDRLRTL